MRICAYIATTAACSEAKELYMRLEGQPETGNEHCSLAALLC